MLSSGKYLKGRHKRGKHREVGDGCDHPNFSEELRLCSEGAGARRSKLEISLNRHRASPRNGNLS